MVHVAVVGGDPCTVSRVLGRNALRSKKQSLAQLLHLEEGIVGEEFF